MLLQEIQTFSHPLLGPYSGRTSSCHAYKWPEATRPSAATRRTANRYCLSWGRFLPIRLYFPNHVRPARQLFSLHLVASICFWRTNWNSIINMTLKYDCFLLLLKWCQSGLIYIYHCSTGKSNLDGLPTSKAGSEQSSFPWCLMSIGTMWHS